MRPLSWKWLADSGLTFDWMTLFVGWKGFGQRNLSGEEILDAAQERVGLGTSQQDKLAALLMHADPRDFWTIRDYLEQLAETETVSETTALRKWRYAELHDWLPREAARLANHKSTLIALQEADYDDAFMEFVYFSSDIADFWREYDKLPDSITLSDKLTTDMKSPEFEKVIQQHFRWLADEQRELKAAQEVNNEHSGN